MFKVGLCGGIASGKSTISRIFESLGVSIVDTDLISHELMQPGQVGYQKTLDHFGPEILLPNAAINRNRLRELVFNDPDLKRWLEQMLHPLIKDEAIKLMQEISNTPYVLLVVPLMFETGFNQLVDHVIAIDCPRSVQITRLIQRDGINEKLANQILDAQINNEERIRLADSIISNSENSDPSEQISTLHHKLILLSTHLASKAE